MEPVLHLQRGGGHGDAGRAVDDAGDGREGLVRLAGGCGAGAAAGCVVRGGRPAGKRLENLEFDAGFAAAGPAEQLAAARALQARVFESVPFVPLGQYFQPTAYRRTLRGVLDGFAIFWNIMLDG